MLQPTIMEELEEEEIGEVVETEEIVAVGEPVMEMAVDEDTTMQDAPVVVLMAEEGPLAEAMRTTLMDTIKELLGIWSDGTIHGYLKPSLVEIAWQNLQEMCRLCESLDH